jgi:peroxiredoxin
MIRKIIPAAACLLPLGLLAQNGFTIKGKIGELDPPAKVYLSYTDAGKKVLDSAGMHKGSFRFTGSVNSPGPAYLIVRHDTAALKGPRRDELYFYIENSEITVTAKDSVNKAIVKGSSTNEDERMLRLLQLPYRITADSLKKAYFAKTAEERKDSAFIKAMGIVMRESQAGYDSVSNKFITDHPDSYIALQTFASTGVGYNFNPDTAAEQFSRFSSVLRNSDLGKRIFDAIEKGRQTSAGVVAMDFAQQDSTGKTVKLSDYRGQFVLVDFWASWCKPCRAENPNLLAAYNKYKDKNFTILGVSLDETGGRKAWLGAVKHDGLPWTQVSDLQGFDSKAAILYGITAIPANFLIDPTGKIIAKNLRGKELDKKLGELFSK